MDPYTLGYLAGHSDLAATLRFVHPQNETVLAAMEKVGEARIGHTVDSEVLGNFRRTTAIN
jgi:hypothetical protein